MHRILNLRLITLVSIFMITGCAQYDTARETLESIEPDTFTCTVQEVKSADTFLCQFPDLNMDTIKLAGIIIPGKNEAAAKSLSKRVLRRGTLVNIEPDYDAKSTANEIQAYVWVPGGKMLNIVMVERGYADVSEDEVIQKYEAVFIRAQGSSNQEEEVIEEVEIKKEPWRK